MSQSNLPGVSGQPCPSWAYGVLGFKTPTRIPCGGLAGHDGNHRWEMIWAEDEPSERWHDERWLPVPLESTKDNIDESCSLCRAKSEANHGAWPCHRCGHGYHMGFCGGKDSERAVAEGEREKRQRWTGRRIQRSLRRRIDKHRTPDFMERLTARIRQDKTILDRLADPSESDDEVVSDG